MDAENKIKEIVPDMRRHIADTCGSLEADFTAASALRDDRYERHHTHVTDCISKLDSQLQLRDHQQRDRINELSCSMEQNYEQWVEQSNVANASKERQIQMHTDALKYLQLRVESYRSHFDTSVDNLGTLFMDYRRMSDGCVTSTIVDRCR